MKARIASSLALALIMAAIAGCGTYDSASAGGTARYGDTYDYQGEASTHNSAL